MTQPNMPHTIAVLRGAVEGDESKYLGSLMALEQHAASLLAAGLVTRGDLEEFVATPAGRDFYAAHRLDELPASRANAWVGEREQQLLEDALAALNRLLGV